MLTNPGRGALRDRGQRPRTDRKSTRLNSSHLVISYAVFCLKKTKISPAAHPVARTVAAYDARGFWIDVVARALFVVEPREHDRQRPFAAMIDIVYIETATTEIYALALHDSLPI